MLDDDAYCVDVLPQITVASGALSKVCQTFLASRVKSCVADTMKNGCVKGRDAKLAEIIEIFRKNAQLVV